MSHNSNRNQRRKYHIPTKPGNFGRPKEATKKTKKISPEDRKDKFEYHRIIDFCLQNVNSIHGEGRENLARLGIADSKADAIILTETKLGKNSNEFQVPGYKIVAQQDRKLGAGGIMILAKTNMVISEAGAQNVAEDIQAAHFKIGNLLAIGIYRSPTIEDNWVTNENHRLLIEYLDAKLLAHGKNPWVITGDFNLKDLANSDFDMPNLREAEEWETPTSNQRWLGWYNYQDARQYVDVPTFLKSENRLDLVFTPKDQDIATLRVSELFGQNFDHKTVQFGIPLDFVITETPFARRSQNTETWKKYRQILMKTEMTKNAAILIRDFAALGYDTAEDCLDEYITSLQTEAYEEATPEVLVKTPPIEGYLTRDTVQLIRRSKRRFRTLRWAIKNKMWNEEKIEVVRRELKVMKKSVKFSMQRDRNVNDQRMLEISEKKNENFYKFYNKKTKKTVSKNNAVRDLNGDLQTSKEGIANTFNDYLGNTLKDGEPVKIEWETEHFTLSSTGYLRLVKPSIHPNGPKDTLNSIWITPEAVVRQIKMANRNAAPGPNGLPMLAFTEAVHILKDVLAMLYNMVGQSGNIPKSWKTTRVVMLHKKKSMDDVKNYRPLSMSNHGGKIWERLVNEALKNHLEENKLLDPNQHGFRNGMGTQTNLLEMWEKIVDKLEKEGALVEFWSFDLTKAFDLLDHNKVLHLLKEAGVTGSVGKMIEHWLCGRTQYVETGGFKSRTVPVNKSCVQGSVLGPTLWLVYIQSLMNKLKANGVSYYGYADDIAIVKTIKTDSDREEFEVILKILEDWAKEYGMLWSPLKTQRLVMKYKGCKEPRTPHEIRFLGEVIIPQESKAESLGLLISKNCLFGAHIKRIADRLRSINFKVRRNFISRDPKIMQKIYNTYMMPCVDYCSIIYNPGSDAMIRPITKAVEAFWKLCSSDKPHENFMDPRLRLILNDLVFFHGMAHGVSIINFKKLFKEESPISPEMLKENAYFRDKKLRIPKWRLKLAKNRFSFRVRKYWNLLPKRIKLLKRFGFKREVKKYIRKFKRTFLNLGLKGYNVIGDLPVKKIRRNNYREPTKSKKIGAKKLINSLSSNLDEINVKKPHKGQGRNYS